MKFSLLLVLLTGCSFFINKFDKDIFEEKKIKPLTQDRQTYCDIIQKNILIAESQNSIDLFESFIKQVGKKIRLDFIDKAVLWSLVQMNARPDLGAPSGKYQIFLYHKNKNYFFHAQSKADASFPHFFLMEKLLDQFRSRHGLLRLAKVYDQYFPAELTVSSGLEKFLTKFQSKIKKDAILSEFYIRGDETLKQGETLPKLKMASLYKLYNNSPVKYEWNESLFKSKRDQSLEYSCNFEMDLYKNSMFLVNDDLVNSHLYGIKTGESMFMGVTSQKIEKIIPIADHPIFQGSSQLRSASMCYLQEPSSSNQIWLVSTQSRDPGQHIYHLVEYGLENLAGVRTLDNMIKFSRHQFLKNPVRLVIESRRSSDKQINELLKLNIPIYNAKKLGQVWAYFKSKKESAFIIDERRDGSIKCSSK